MTFLKTAASAATLALIATTSHAEGMRIGAGISMFGPTVEAQSRLGNAVTVRGTYSGYGASGTQTIDGIDYTLSGRLGGLSAMFNYHMPGGFRVGAGFFKSTSSVTGSTSFDAGDEVGGFPLGEASSFEGKTTFARTYSPITTVGLDIPVFGDLVLSTDAGMIFNGGYNVDFTQTSGTDIPGSNLSTAEQNLEDQLSNYKVFPYVSMMVGMWF
jgi:hypothetical protein